MELLTVHASTGFYFLPRQNDDTLLLQRPAVGLSIFAGRYRERTTTVDFLRGREKFFRTFSQITNRMMDEVRVRRG